MRKILFIEPKAPGLHIFSGVRIPRLGAIILATIARQCGWESEVIFEEAYQLHRRNLPEADLVGISTITSTASRAYQLADAYRNQNIPVIMGGAHVTFMAEEALNHCDFVIRGEGEHAFREFLKAFSGDRDYEAVPNLSYTSNGKACHNPVAVSPETLDDIPTPDFSTIKKYFIPRSLRVIPVETSRGCPFKCSFCSVSRIFGRKVRFRQIDDVIKNLEDQVPRGCGVFFVDDNFTAHPAHTKLLMRAMIEKKLKIAWSAQVRVESAMDQELLNLMYKAGCRSVYIGIETINDETLARVEKKQTVEQVSEGIKNFRKSGIKVHGMFILGFDEDDRKTAKETVKYAKNIGLNSVQFLILTPLPGTPVYLSLVRNKRILTGDWHYYDAHHVVFRPKLVQPFDLQKMQIWSHKKFYSLGQQLKHLTSLDFTKLLIAIYASKMNIKWRRLNREFLMNLKKLTDYITPVQSL